MLIPKGHTEATVMAAIDRAVDKLCPTFVFGFHTLEDIQQHARAQVIEALNDGKFDPAKGSLAAFSYSHIRKRLINLLRDKWRRPDYSCSFCERAEAAGTYALCGEDHCRRELEWRKTNASKMSLNKPLDIDGISDEGERRMRDFPRAAAEAEYSELLALIDERLPPGLREDYLRVRDGGEIPEGRRAALEKELRGILGVDD